MASIKEKAQKATDKIAEKATEVGHRISEGVEKAGDWAKEKLHEGSNRVQEAAQKVKISAKDNCGSPKSKSDIREHMAVMGSCGNQLGTVDRVEGDSIKLTKSGSSDGQHHLIPTAWVSRIDEHVHLSKDCGDAKAQWRTV